MSFATVSSSSSSSSSKSFFSSFVSKNLSHFFPPLTFLTPLFLSRDSDFPTTTAKSPSSSRECRHGFCRWRARHRVFFPSARSSSRERGSRVSSEDGDERNIQSNGEKYLEEYREKYIKTGSILPVYHAMAGVFATAYVVTWPTEYRHFKAAQEGGHH